MGDREFTLYRSAYGYGLRIVAADGQTWEYCCVSYDPAQAETLMRRMRQGGLDPVHYGEVIRDFITEQYLRQLELNGLAV